MKVTRKFARAITIFSLSTFVLISNSDISIAAPTNMPTIAGQIGVVKKNLEALGFTKPVVVLQQKPPTAAYACRPVENDDFVISQDPMPGASVSAETQITLTTVCHLTTPQNAVVKTPYIPPKSTKSKNSSNSQVTITCVKGKSVKKVTASKPVCPKGFVKK